MGLQPWQQEAKTRPLKQAAGSSIREVSAGIPKGLALRKETPLEMGFRWWALRIMLSEGSPWGISACRKYCVGT